MSNQELTKIDDAEVVRHTRKPHGALALRDEDGGMTVEGMVERRRKIRRVIEEVMEPDVHYGRIPGCGPKPALFKGGAEVLCQTFGLAAKYAAPEILDLGGHHREVRVRCTVVHVATDSVVAEGIGSCSTVERKYRRSEPADVYNTVLKMAAKRAMVMGVIAATGTSDVLTQDIEDDDHEEKPRRDNTPPQQRSAQPERPPHREQSNETKAASADHEPAVMKLIGCATSEIELASLVPQLTKLSDAWRAKARKRYGDRLVEIRKETESIEAANKRQQIQIVRDDGAPPPTQEHAS